MTLTLEISAASVGSSDRTRHVFGKEGGTIGRGHTCTWVLANRTVSAQHARISWKDGTFYVHDISRNGIALNSPDAVLVPNRPYPLKTGDRILIEPYEIQVWVQPSSGAERSLPLQDPYEPFAFDDPFQPVQAAPLPAVGPLSEAPGNDELDPLKFLEPVSSAKPRSRERPKPPEDVLDSHYRPPAPFFDGGITKSALDPIPAGYDPLAPEEPPSEPVTPSIARPRPGRDTGSRRPPFAAPPVATPPIVDVPPAIPAAAIQTTTPEPVPREPVPPPSNKVPASAPDVNFAELLAGAGIPDAVITPELAKTLGGILRIVVAGLMDVLQSRQQIKEEFRMYHTLFRPKGNNPLKFSANVEDALYNLLVKQNPAYLTPVDAFAEAFDDLRDHQLAMLAGMRGAFESMLAEFDPSHLQQEFERHSGKGSLALLPAKMRYWDMYREHASELAKDPEEAFSRLFGETFKRVYEEQFRQLKAQRGGRTSSDPPE